MSRRELFGSLCAMVFLINLARVIFAPLVQPAAADFGVTAASLGIVASAAWLGSAAPRLPTGYLLTRIDRHQIVAFTGILLVATSLFTASSQTVSTLTIGAFLMGLSSGMYYVAANPLIGELFPTRIGRAIGIHGTASQIAAVIAPIIVSLILLIGNWRLTFYVIAGVAVLTTLLLVFAARRTDLPRVGTEDRSVIAAGRSQWPVILTGMVFIGTAGFLWNALFNLYGDYLDIVKGIDPATGRLLLSVMFVAGVPAFFVAGRIADRFPRIPLLLLTLGGFTAGVLILTFIKSILVLAVVSFFIGYMFFSLLPIVDTYVLSSLPNHHRGSAYSLYSSSMMVIQAFGSGVIGTVVAGGMSYTIAFQTVGVVVCGIIIIMLTLYYRNILPTGSAPGTVATE